MSTPGRQQSDLDLSIDSADSDTLRRAIALIRLWRAPALPGLVFSIAIVLAGFAGLAFTVWKVVGNPYVPLQLPFLVSGGMGGAALVVLGSVLGAALLERWDRALARIEMQDAVDETVSILSLVTRRHEK